MLRRVLLGVACVLATVGLFCLFTGKAGAWPVAVWGLVLLLAVVFERWRYSQRNVSDSGEWQETEERFVDPESGRLMQVLYRPATGDRRYVPVGDEADHGN